MTRMLSTELDSRRRAADDSERIKLHGKAPDNPFEQLREAHHLSISELALYSKIDRKALSRLESGLYTNPLPALVEYWVRKGVTTEGELVTYYEDYIFEQRRRHDHYFGPNLGTDYLSPIHPFRQLRERRPSLIPPNEVLPVGLLECARAMCVPVDTIQFFEKKYRTQQSVPKGMKQALNQMGYSRDQIAAFEETYKLWRANKPKVTFL